MSDPDVPAPLPAPLGALSDADAGAAIWAALEGVMDPELGIDIVTLELIRGVRTDTTPVAISMVLTTPFCPYGPALLETIRASAQEASGRPVTIELLAERWEPPEEVLAFLGMAW